MSTDWRSLPRKSDFLVDDHTITVDLAGGRTQRIYVEDGRESALLRIWSVVARSAVVDAVEDDPLFFAWQRNRVSDLVGFKVDPNGRPIGEAWVPFAGLSEEEWATYVIAVARSCDRAEYLLTGKDSD